MLAESVFPELEKEFLISARPLLLTSRQFAMKMAILILSQNFHAKHQFPIK